MAAVKKLSVIEKLGFGMGDAACGIVYSSVTMFLTYFYTDIYGLSAAAVGVMFLVTRILDAVSDPLTGIVADRVKTRWGHFRPWLIWFAIPYAVLAVMTFTSSQLSRPTSPAHISCGTCESKLICHGLRKPSA